MKALLHARHNIRLTACALLCALALSGVLAMGHRIVFAAAPTTGIGFQGQLYNGGLAVSGSVGATFSFYDALSGGSLQGSAISKTISVSNGYFATTFSSAELASIDLNQSLWIEVVVEGNTLTPRSPVNSVPFANKAFGAFSYASAPSAGPAGSLYYDSLNSRLMVSNGSSWATVGTTSSASIATTTINGASGPSFSFATGSSGTDFSIATSTGTVTFNIPTASASNRGLLSSSDYLRIPSSASSSEWASFFATPSSRISAGANLAWTGNSIGFSGVLPVANGGTGTTTAPTFGQILMGDSSGGFNLVATSSLGITGGSGTNYLSLGNGYIAASTSTDAIRAAYFVASSTTATSTFAGAVGIGTTTPAAALAVMGSASASSRNLLVLASSTGAAQLTVNASGEVGIGGSLSGNKLYVSGLTVLDSFNNGGGTTPLTIKNAGTSAGSLVSLAFHAGNSIQASLYADVAHNLRFNVRNMSDTNTIEVMRLTGDGYVGIGTTTPAQVLSVAGGMRLTGAFFDSANASGTAGMVLQTTGTGTQWVATSSLGITGGSGSGNSAFTIASGMIYNATSTDLVGIGTTSPSTTLFVQGKGGANPFAIASSTGAQMLTLSQTGYLGIGNSSPVAPLTFAQAAGDKIQLYPGGASSRWGFGIQNWTFVQYMDGGNPGIGKFSWRTAPSSGDASSGTEVANLYTSGQLDLLDSTNGVLRAYGSGNNYFAGNVGIGTTTPAQKLSVVGGMRLTGAFFDSANASGTAGMILQTTGTGTQWVATSSLGITGGSGSGNSAFAIASGMIYNATSTDLVGIGTTSPSTTLFVQGKGGTNPFAIASSTGTSLLVLDQSGALTGSNGGFKVGSGGFSLSSSGLNYSSTARDSITIGSLQPGGAYPWRISSGSTSFTNGYVSNEVDGQEMTRVTSAGFGIGSTSPTALLTVTGTTSAPTAALFDIASSTYASILRVTSGGLVGIGTTTPAQALSVAGGMRLTGAFFDSANASGTAGMILQTTGTGTQWVATSSLGASGINSGTAGQIAYYAANGSTLFGTTSLFISTTTGSVGIGNPTGDVSPDRALTIFTGQTTTPQMRLGYNDSFFWDIGRENQTTGRLMFTDQTGEKLSLLNSGNFGIGTTTPGQALVVQGSAHVQGVLTVASTTGSSVIKGAFSASNGPNQGLFVSAGGGVTAAGDTNSLRVTDSDGSVLLSVTGNESSGDAAFSIGFSSVGFSIDQATGRFSFTGGSLGIGTTTPAQALSVAGGMRLTGALFDSANASGTAGMVLQTTGTGTQWVATSSLGITGGSGSGNSAFAIASGMIYNATSTDLVGIGTTSPSTTLFVQGKGGTNPFAIASSTGTQILTLSQAGNLGIGTTTPAAKLSLSSGGLNPWNNASGGLYVTNNAGGTIGGFTNSTPNDYSVFGVYRPGGVADSGDFQFSAHGSSYSSSGLYTASTVLGAARSDFTGGLKLGAQAGPVSFFAGGITLSNIGLTLSTTGNVGIGTTTPATRLSVYDTGDSASITTFTQGLANGGINVSSDFSAGNYTPGLFWSTINNNAGRPKAGIFPQHTNTGTFLYIGTSNDYATGISNTAIAIDPSGNVGIGSSSPATKLSITGVSGSVLDILTVASSTQARLFSVSPAGNITASGSVVWSSNGNSLGNNAINFAGNNPSTIGNVSAGSSAAMTVQGGANAASSLTLKSTSVAGTTDYVRIVVGNNGATEALRAISNGSVGIGTTTPGQVLTVVGNAQFTGVTSGAYASDLNLTAEGILTTSASDERLKENIQALGAPALPNILALKTYSFNWKSDPSHRADIGLIAQEVEPLFPELVFTNQNDGFKGINYSRLSVYLIKGMQEQQVEIDQLKNYATFIRTKELHTEKLCIGDETDEVCITKEDLRKIMFNSNIQPTATSTPDIVPVVMPDSSPAVMSGDAGTTPPTEEGSPVTPPSDDTATSPDPSSAPVPEAAPDPAPAPEAAPAPAPEAAPAPVDGSAGSGDVPAV